MDEAQPGAELRRFAQRLTLEVLRRYEAAGDLVAERGVAFSTVGLIEVRRDRSELDGREQGRVVHHRELSRPVLLTAPSGAWRKRPRR